MHTVQVQGKIHKLVDIYENIRYATEFVVPRKRHNMRQLRTSVCRNSFMRKQMEHTVSYVSIANSTNVFCTVPSGCPYPVPNLANTLFEEYHGTYYTTYSTLFVFENDIALLFNKRGYDCMAWNLMLKNGFTAHKYEWFQFWFSYNCEHKTCVYQALKDNKLSFYGYATAYERLLRVSYGRHHQSTTRDYLPTHRV